MDILYFVLVSTIIGAMVSSGKGRSWAEGFGLGLFLGPFGVITAACMPTIKPLTHAVYLPKAQRLRQPIEQPEPAMPSPKTRRSRTLID
jgi:hypothetical protein